ncbi:phospholipid scramblase-related protein [Actinophytocola xanthii]|uniref:Scramblase n=1 Tax=Actinophytocola xanthii TaxID=1912961 RepID=A0A1Q8CFZ4_9PSEU|nr:phospholipid scramblase-related protein [Actinophytocola xanthii]OLF13286.1 scramblase [Actinophytocola xanthii]
MAQPPGWYPERPGSSLSRWWDGTRWTEYTRQAIWAAPAEESVDGGQDTIRRQLREAGVRPRPRGGGTLFTEPVLVVNQMVDHLANDYLVFDQHGGRLGSVVQVRQSFLHLATRQLYSRGVFLTHHLEVRDAASLPLLLMTRPRTLGRSRVMVRRPYGTEVGEIVQENLIGRIRFSFLVGGQRVGGIEAEESAAWNFSIVDHTGGEVARITKAWEGLLTEVFSTADNYVVQLHRPLPDPLASLVIGSAITIDIALEQVKKMYR